METHTPRARRPGLIARALKAAAAALMAPNAEERARDRAQRHAAPLMLPDGALAACRYVVFDLETTGLQPSHGDRIVAIGAVRVEAGRILDVDRFATFAQPGRPIPPASTAIHGITDAMVAGSPPWPEAVAAFHRFAGDAVLVAHNAAFDTACLHAAEAQAGVTFANPVLCSLRLSQWLDPDEKAHDLDGLAARHGVVIAGRHDALGDAEATAALFCDMLRRAEARRITSLAELFARTRMARQIAAAAERF
ncbi:PolC-type DNA polymerase III [Elioraea sp.]|uniref:3'-5' exonuclease n=1 Tax=Elioraea sp. TaxID=2185103 RepID=UPI0025B829D7|nr:3'-5' exonuclease [Elioraea sp.]